MSEHEVLAYKIICNLVKEKSSVLDLGCGSGELLLMLREQKKVKGQGIELSENAIFQCVEKGISVFHSDIEIALGEYPDKSFDYVVLHHTMQEVGNVQNVLQEALRVGEKVIIGFPNFAYLRSRLRLLIKGKAPVTYSLPYRWYDTPNVHFLSIKDFFAYCEDKKINILGIHFLAKFRKIKFLPNLFAENALFVLSCK